MDARAAFEPEQLIIGILGSPEAGEADEERLGRELESRFGGFEYGPRLPFPWSGYYDEEMGGRPRRCFASFAESVDPSALASIKVETNRLESLFSRPCGGRLFNLDPGLLSLPRFVLATTKQRPHRLPLSQGIYGELTLIYESGEYKALAWTYPDWASDEYRAYLGTLRASIKARQRVEHRVQRFQ